MTLSLNGRARDLADRLAADGDALRVATSTLADGTRVIDCGSAVPGGLEAGRRFAEITMAGLGSITFAPVVLDGRWLPGLTVVTDRPALACLASQYAGWRIDREGYFAMASGPGRALIRAEEELYDDLDVDERASAAVLYLGQVELTVDAPDDELEDIVERVPSTASKDHGEPFGSLLEHADWDFYKIDPMLFSPAEVRLVSVGSGRSFIAGAVDLAVLERSFRG